jgi:N-methylhydantoinase B
VIAPEGTVVNVAFPGATFMRGLTIYRINNVLFGALAKAMPERAIAADEGGTSIVLMEGEDRNRERFIYMETISGAWGGRARLDGIDTASNITGLQSNTPAEVLETEYPIELVQYGYVQDSGGAGRFRGGLGLVREYRYVAERGTLQMRADRVKFAPYGIYGGKPGGRCKNVFDPYGSNVTLESKVKSRPLRGGDVVRHVMAGGGGYGWPFERDIERVLRDVLDEKVSLAAAREDYGVVIDEKTLQADLPATERLRAEMRARVDVAKPPMYTQ